MPQWQGSNRRSRLPADWARIRQRILKRDSFRCTWIQDGTRCPNPATDVDHRRAGDDHSDANLRSLCGEHHRRKSSSEGGAALAALRKKHSKKFRRDEPHPGLIV